MHFLKTALKPYPKDMVKILHIFSDNSKGNFLLNYTFNSLAILTRRNAITSLCVLISHVYSTVSFSEHFHMFFLGDLP